MPFADDTFDAVAFTYLLCYVADPTTTIEELLPVDPSGCLWPSQWWLLLPRAGLVPAPDGPGARRLLQATTGYIAGGGRLGGADCGCPGPR